MGDMIFFSFSALMAFFRIFYVSVSALSGVRVFQITVEINTVQPARHESNRLSKSYSCLSAQPMADHVRVDFTEFYASWNLFSQTCLRRERRLHEVQNSVKSSNTRCG